VIPGAKLSVYEGVGHSPFYEDAARFNAELAAFVRTAARPINPPADALTPEN
jgi:pimeloyl-ACP methyl ester carboxylesterase